MLYYHQIVNMFDLEKNKKNLLFPILVSTFFLLLILLLVLVWFIFDVYRNKEAGFLQNAGEKKIVQNSESLDLSNKDPEVGGIVEKVSKHILLPASQFTVATVKDAAALYKENPVLYQYLRNGQRMVIYDTGAIVYDESLDKIVDVIQLYAARQEKLFPSKK